MKKFFIILLVLLLCFVPCNIGFLHDIDVSAEAKTGAREIVSFYNKNTVDGSISNSDPRFLSGFYRYTHALDHPLTSGPILKVVPNPENLNKHHDLTKYVFTQDDKENGFKTDAVISFYMRAPIDSTYYAFFMGWPSGESRSNNVVFNYTGSGGWERIVIPLQSFTAVTNIAKYYQFNILCYDKGIVKGDNVEITPVTIYTNKNFPDYCDPDIALYNSEIELELQESAFIKTKTTHPFGKSPVKPTFSYSSDNSDIVTVDNLGCVTALGIGTAVITVSASNGWYEQCTVTVLEKVQYTLSIDNENIITDKKQYRAGEEVEISFSQAKDLLYCGGTLKLSYQDNGVLVSENIDDKTLSFKMPPADAMLSAEFIDVSKESVILEPKSVQSCIDQTGTRLGLRFITEINLSSHNEIFSQTVYIDKEKYNITDMGILIVPSDVPHSDELLADSLAVKKISSMGIDDSGNMFVRATSDYRNCFEFGIYMLDIIPERTYLYRSYIQLENTAGELCFLYSDTESAKYSTEASEIISMPTNQLENKCVFDADFVKGIWQDHSDGVVSISRNALSSDDENYHQFQTRLDYTMNDPDAYYSAPVSRYVMLYGNVNGQYSEDYLNLDLSGYYKTSVLRFWVKVPRSGINMTVGLLDASYVVSRYTFTVLKADEWIEMQIPIEEFMNRSQVFDEKRLRNIIIQAGVESDIGLYSALGVGETVSFGAFEIWSSSPEQYENTFGQRYFYDPDEKDICIVDSSSVLSQSTDVRFVINESESELTNIDFNVEGIKTSGIIDVYGYDLYSGKHIRDELLSSVEMRIGIHRDEITRAMDDGTLLIGIYNDDTIYLCDFDIVSGNVCFETDKFGRIVIMSADTNVAASVDSGELTKLTDNSYIKRSAGAHSIEMAIYLHPGVVGFNIEYPFAVYVDGVTTSFDDYTIICDDTNVAIGQGSITVPAQYSEQGKTVKLIVTHNSDLDSYSDYIIKFRRFVNTMNDEFEGDELNSDYWSVRKSWNNETDERSNPDNAIVQDGKLVLKADKIEYEGADYSHIFIETKDKFTQTYGCFTASIKVADKGGTNTAFWMLPNFGDWGAGYFYNKIGEDSWCGEIDMLETSPTGDFNNNFQTTLHYWSSDGKSRRSGWSAKHGYDDTRNEYHEYSCVWTCNALYIYFDGKLLHRFIGIEATKNPAYLLLDLELGAHNDSGVYDWCGTYSDGDLPIYAYVDYVKVYK